MISSSSAPTGTECSESRPRDPLGECSSSRSDAERLTATLTSRPARAPRGDLRDGSSRTNCGEPAHRPALLDDVQERVGVEQPARRVLPAHERLGAEGRAGLEVDLRLVVQDELVVDESGGEAPAPSRGARGSPRRAPGRRVSTAGVPALAAYIATSARRNRSAIAMPEPSRSAIPALACIATWTPSITTGAASAVEYRAPQGPARRRRRRARPAGRTRHRPGASRAGRDAGLRAAASLRAVSRSSSSPRCMAERVVDELEVVEVDAGSARGGRRALRPADAPRRARTARGGCRVP